MVSGKKIIEKKKLIYDMNEKKIVANFLINKNRRERTSNNGKRKSLEAVKLDLLITEEL